MGTVMYLRVGKLGIGKMGVGQMGHIIDKAGVGKMGVGERGVNHLPNAVFMRSFPFHLFPLCLLPFHLLPLNLLIIPILPILKIKPFPILLTLVYSYFGFLKQNVTCLFVTVEKLFHELSRYFNSISIHTIYIFLCNVHS